MIRKLTEKDREMTVEFLSKEASINLIMFFKITKGNCGPEISWVYTKLTQKIIH